MPKVWVRQGAQSQHRRKGQGYQARTAEPSSANTPLKQQPDNVADRPKQPDQRLEKYGVGFWAWGSSNNGGRVPLEPNRPVRVKRDFRLIEGGRKED
jgi:hypothetical protein